MPLLADGVKLNSSVNAFWFCSLLKVSSHSSRPASFRTPILRYDKSLTLALALVEEVIDLKYALGTNELREDTLLGSLLASHVSKA